MRRSFSAPGTGGSESSNELVVRERGEDSIEPAYGRWAAELTAAVGGAGCGGGSIEFGVFRERG